MTSYNAGEFKKGLKVIVDNEPYLMVETEFVKPGKGQALYRIKLKNLLRGNIVDRTFRSGDKLDEADVHIDIMQYLYNDSKNWMFMHQETYEQVSVPLEVIGDARFWIKEESDVDVTFYGDKAIAVTPPNHVELKVVYCEPAVRGNTATNVQKPVKLESGAEVTVPLFINQGDIIKIDTRTHEYIERVSQS
jgi:elongation factor P